MKTLILLETLISGNKMKTGEYLDSTIFETEKSTYYLSNLIKDY